MIWAGNHAMVIAFNRTDPTFKLAQSMKRVLVICLGNICRSPAAQGVLEAMARSRGLRVHVDSAGTGGWHEGEQPDQRMIDTAKRRGYDLTPQRARQVDFSDFYEFDYLLAMDLRNQSDLLAMAPPNRECDIRLYLDFSPEETREMPDPYYGGTDGFERVLDLVESGAAGFLDHLENESG